MSAEIAIYAVLAADSGVTDLVGTRIYPVRALRGASLPYITYQRISTVRRHPLDRPTDLADARVQVDCWAGSYAEAKTLAAAVRSALAGYRGTAGGVTVQWMGLEGEADDVEIEGGVESLTCYRVRQDWDIWWQET